MTPNELVVFSVFMALVILMLMTDIGVFGKKDHEIRFGEALGWTLTWIFLALMAGAFIFFFGEKIHGATSYDELAALVEKYGHPIQLNEGDFAGSAAIYRKNLAFEFFTGYLVEYSLSIDNIFVFVLIFYSFGVEKKYYHRILFWGILGAIIMRFLFIFITAVLIQQFEWILVFFGVLLIFTGIRMFVERNKEKRIDPGNHPVVRLVSKVFPVDREYNGHSFFIRKNGRLFISTLFVVLVVIEFSDVIFAVDSVPAIFSITKDPFIVYFSNIFAIIGLRSLFFLLINMIEKFRFLHIALSVLLTFIGVKMVAHFFDWFDLSTTQSLAIIGFIIAGGILASVSIPPSKKSLTPGN